jgi:hypothetical protein
MKNILYILLLVNIVFTSCEKEEKYIPSTLTVVEKDPYVSPIGYKWELVDAKVFVTKKLSGGNGQVVSKKYYDHFGTNKNTSNMDIFVPSWLPIDNIIKDVTTFQLSTSGFFTLNDNQQYDYTYTEVKGLNSTIRVNGLENGSARVFSILKATESYMHVEAYLSQASDSQYDYDYYTILEFVKVGGSGVYETYKTPYDFVYSGVWNATPQPNTNDMTGQKWVVTRYNNGLSGNVYPNDTLEFTSQNKYKINGSPLKSYTLTNVTGNNMKSLSLYSFTTLGGDYSGQVMSTFTTDGVINNSNFVDMFNVNNTVTVWMERIQ